MHVSKHKFRTPTKRKLKKNFLSMNWSSVRWSWTVRMEKPILWLVCSNSDSPKFFAVRHHPNVAFVLYEYSICKSNSVIKIVSEIFYNIFFYRNWLLSICNLSWSSLLWHVNRNVRVGRWNSLIWSRPLKAFKRWLLMPLSRRERY